MKNVTYIEFQDFLGEHGFPAPRFEFGERYQITRYECTGTFDGVTSSRTAECHAQVKRGIAHSAEYFIPTN